MLIIRPGGKRDLLAVHIDTKNEFSNILEINHLDGPELFILESPNQEYKKIKIKSENIKISGSDITAFHSNKSNEFFNLINKEIPSDNDILSIEDSNTLFSKKYITIESISGGDPMYDMDTIPQGVIYNKVLVDDNIKLNSITSSSIDIDDSVIKRHIQNTDTTLGLLYFDIDMNGFAITNISDPFSSGDCVNKTYADAVSGGDPDAFHKNLPDEISLLLKKYNIINTDHILIEDSENLNEKKASTIEYIHSTTNIDFIENGILFKKIPTLDATKLSSITSSAIDIDDAVDKRHTQGTDTTLGILTTNINLGNNIINNSALPILDTDLASKGYVDNNISTDYNIPELFRPIQDANFPAAVSDPGWSQYLEVNRAYFGNTIGGSFADSILLPNGSVMFLFLSPGNNTYTIESINNSTNWITTQLGYVMGGPISYGTFPNILGNINSEAFLIGSYRSPTYIILYLYIKHPIETLIQMHGFDGGSLEYITTSILGLPHDNSVLLGITNPDGAFINKFRDLSIFNGDPNVPYSATNGYNNINSIIELYQGLIYAIITNNTTFSTRIIKSEDNGTTWSNIFESNESWGILIDTVYCGNNRLIAIKYGWTSNPYDPPRYYLVKSIDKGLTWQEISNTETTEQLKFLRYLRKNTILATGGETIGLCYISTDNGDNFYKINDTYSGHKSLGRAIQNTDGNIYVPSISNTEGYKIWRIESSPQVIKKSFISTDLPNTFGQRKVKTFGTDGVGQFNFVFPKDFIRFGQYGGIYLVFIPSSGASQTSRNINLVTEYDNGPGTLYNFYTESDLSTLYNLSGKTDEITTIDFTHLVSAPGAGKTGGIDVNHNSVGGNIYYLGIEIVYL